MAHSAHHFHFETKLLKCASFELCSQLFSGGAQATRDRWLPYVRGCTARGGGLYRVYMYVCLVAALSEDCNRISRQHFADCALKISLLWALHNLVRFVLSKRILKFN